MEGALNFVKKRSNLLYYIVVAILVIACGLNFYHVDTYVTMPGSADEIKPMLSVEDGSESKGSYNLVTILVDQKRSNVYRYLWAKFDGNPYTQLMPAEAMTGPDENQHEREVSRLDNMTQAQQRAIYVAAKTAGLDPKLKFVGVHILNVISDMPASDKLKAGDIILKASGKDIRSSEQLQKIVKQQNKGDRLSLTIRRDDEEKTYQVPVGQFPDVYVSDDHSKQYGIGITFRDKMDVQLDRKVTIDTKNIGGPSAGLMMTLAVYDNLEPKDLTKGRKICGTGTINTDGSVGPIGGIQQKVVASDNANCDIFFAPTADNEAQDAKAAAKDIKTDMKVIPTKSFNTALNDLQKQN